MINIAAYHFAPMQNLSQLRAELLEFCKERSLKGTILLAPEGINMFLAGESEAIADIVDKIRQLPGMEDIEVKYSESEEQPFTRMLVKLKKEIIAFGIDGIDPANDNAPRVSPQELKKWLDEGRKVVMYDTRNDYEIKLGTFHDAVPAKIDHFRDFPEAVNQLPEEIKDATVVAFCTGGIRCEKAVPYMQKVGFNQVFQLDGGILKYFEECGGEHWEGECFVFDHRVGLDPALAESSGALCYACQEPLTPEEMADPRYVESISCPYCYKDPETEQKKRLAQLQGVLDALPLPGDAPEIVYFPFEIPASLAGQKLLTALETIFPVAEEGNEPSWQEKLDAGQVMRPDGSPATGEEVLKSGERYQRLKSLPAEPKVNGEIRVLAEGEGYWIVEKPTSLPTFPQGFYRRNNLTHILHLAFAPELPRPLYYLSATAGGLMLCARSRHFEKLLKQQIKRNKVICEYSVKTASGNPDIAELKEQKNVRILEITEELNEKILRFEAPAYFGETLAKTFPSLKSVFVEKIRFNSPVTGAPVHYSR